MLQSLFHKQMRYAMKKSVIATMLLLGMVATPCALALQKFPNITDRVEFENASDNGHLFDSGHFVVRHKGDETQIGFTITNTSDDIIDAPYRLVLKRFFSFRRVNVEGVDGYTRRGDPYILLNSSLAPGETTAPIQLTITWPEKKRHGFYRWYCKYFGTYVFFKLRAQQVIETLYDSKADFPANVQQVLDPSADLSDIDHNINNRLLEVSHAIHLLAVLDDIEDADLSRLLDYLSVYSANGPYDVTAEQAEILNTALRAVADMSDFRSLSPSTAGVINNYVYSLRNFYNRENTIPHLDRHLSNIVKLLAFYEEVGDVYAYENLGQAVFATVQTYAYLFSSGETNAELAAVLLGNADLLSAIAAFGANSANSVPPDNHPVLGERYNTWVLDWLMWGMSNHWMVASGDAALAASIDDAVRSIVDAYADDGVFHDVFKKVMYNAFLGNTRWSTRGELCANEFAAQCLTDRSDNPDIFTANVLEVLNPATNYYSFDFPHTAAGRLNEVVAAMNFLAEEDELADPALEQLLDYIDSYAYFSGVDMTADEALAVHQAYLAIADMDDFFSTRVPAGEVLQQYFYGLRNLYSQEPALVPYFSELLPVLYASIDFFVADDDVRSRPDFDDAIFELVSKMAWLASDARWWNTALQDQIVNTEVLDALQNLGSDTQAIFPAPTDTWTMDWFLWSMSSFWHMSDEAGKVDVDNRVRAIILSHAGDPVFELVKRVVWGTYVLGTGRDWAFCTTEFGDICGELDTSNIFVDTMECADVNVKIFAQDMTQQQLFDSCVSMAGQATQFHATMGTSIDTPVADDFNSFLNVYIFDDYSQYDALGNALFGISTDNGGIYIEGDPSDPDNQAAFYAHEAQWLRPQFLVWNLDHEFIHYLDGRYLKYGGFGHFPQEDSVWWAEGIAEFFAQGTDNTGALNLLSAVAEENWPTLAQITHVDYTASADMIYTWSYWVHRFMQANHQAEILALAELFKSGTEADILAIQTTVDDWGTMYQDEFVQYLRDQRDLEASLSALFGAQANSSSNTTGSAGPHSDAPDQRENRFQGRHGRAHGQDDERVGAPSLMGRAH